MLVKWRILWEIEWFAMVILDAQTIISLRIKETVRYFLIFFCVRKWSWRISIWYTVIELCAKKKVYESDVFALCQNCCYHILFISDCLKIFSHEKLLNWWAMLSRMMKKIWLYILRVWVEVKRDMGCLLPNNTGNAGIVFCLHPWYRSCCFKFKSKQNRLEFTPRKTA